MKNTMLKKLSVAVAAGCLGVAASVSQAAPLIPFSNGSTADANDVNANFTELETRITNISLTPGPTGPQGLAGNNGVPGAQGPVGPTGLTGPAGATGSAGPQGPVGATGVQGPVGPAGPAGVNGSGVVVHSWAGFGAAGKWISQTFIVTDTRATNNFDKEVRSYARTITSPGVGTVAMTRERSLASTVVKHQVLNFSFDTSAANTLESVETYDPLNTATLLNTKTLTPGFVFRHAAMGEGMTWSNASTVTTVTAGSPDVVDFGIDTRSLVAIEDITVNGLPYTGCQKIAEHRSAPSMGGEFQAVTWFCPGDGMVKRVRVDANGTRTLELDQAASLLR